MGFVSAISTLLIPGMACLGFRYIFGMRIIQGNRKLYSLCQEIKKFNAVFKPETLWSFRTLLLFLVIELVIEDLKNSDDI